MMSSIIDDLTTRTIQDPNDHAASIRSIFPSYGHGEYKELSERLVCGKKLTRVLLGYYFIVKITNKLIKFAEEVIITTQF